MTTKTQELTIITVGHCTANAAEREEIDCNQGIDCISSIKWLSRNRQVVYVCNSYELEDTEVAK